MCKGKAITFQLLHNETFAAKNAGTEPSLKFDADAYAFGCT